LSWTTTAWDVYGINWLVVLIFVLKLSWTAHNYVEHLLTKEFPKWRTSFPEMYETLSPHKVF
jgi:endonuclease/exonuclease/phosphatase (EEP) superfamily protein YafD